MRLGTGEVAQRRAVTRCVHHTQIDLQAAFEDHAGAGGAGRQHLGHLVVGGKALHHRAAGRGGHQDIEIAHRLAHAAEAARHRHLLDAGDRLRNVVRASAYCAATASL